MSTDAFSAVGARLASAISAKPILFLAVSILLFVACVSGARLLQPDFTYRAFFGEGDPLRIQVQRFEQTFGNDDSVVLIVHNPNGILNAESSRLITELTEKMWLVPDIQRVDSLSNFRWVRAEGDEILVDAMIPDGGLATPELLAERSQAVFAEPLIPDYLLSADGKTTMIVGIARGAGESSPEAEPIIAAVRDMIAASDDGVHEFHITGRLAIMAGMQESAQADVQSVLPIVLLTIVSLVAIATRRIGAVVVTLLLIVTSIMSTMGASGWMGMTISNITAMVPQFILAIAVAAAIHVLMSYQRARREGLERRPAVQDALAKNFVPTLLTSATTAIAFFTFAATHIEAIENLGIMVGVGVLLAWIYTYILLGSLLALLPELRFIKRKTPVVADHPTQIEVRVGAYVNAIAGVRWPIVAVAVLVVIGALFLAASTRINSNPFRYFDESFWLRQSADFAEAHLRGAQGMEVVLNSGEPDGVKSPQFLAKAEALQEWINEQEFVAKTVSIIDFLKQTNRALHGDDPAFYTVPETQQEIAEQLFLYSFNLPQGLELSNRVSAESDKLRISVRWTLYDSVAATEWAERIEQKATALGLDAETTGKMLLFQRMNNYVSQALFISLGLAVLLISVLLLLVFRSVRYGIASLLTNVMPLSIGAAALALAGRDIDTGAVVALSVCLGVVVDDTIHLIYAFRAARGAGTREALVKGITRVLPAITLTTLILVIGFGAFMLGDFVPNQNFGLMAVTIVAVAWLFDLLFLPALLLILDPEKVPTASSKDGVVVEQVRTRPGVGGAA